MKAEIAGLHFTHSDYMIIYAHFFSEFDMYIFMYGFLYLQKNKSKDISQVIPSPILNLPPRSVMLLAF